MTRRAADDFDAIRARMLQIRGEEDPEFAEVEQAACPMCEGGGWEAYGIGSGDPHFRECTLCHNPKGHPSP